MLSQKRVARVRKEIPRSRILKEIQVTSRVAVRIARYSASRAIVYSFTPNYQALYLTYEVFNLRKDNT